MMKYLLLVFGLLLFLISCKKSAQDATLTKDCSGTYLIINTKRYKICNQDLFEPYAEGTRLNVQSYRKLDDCKFYQEDTTCDMLQVYESWIEINIFSEIE
jgi:hypothetical protein